MSSYISVPDFNPVILDLPGPLAISWYGFMYFCGIAFCYGFVQVHIRQKKVLLTSDQFSSILTLIFVGVLLGGRLGYVFLVEPAHFFRNPQKIFAVWEGGMYFFGGLALSLFLPWLLIRRWPVSYLDTADFLIIPAPIALAFGRWGNFMNGEFWGRPTEAPWGMVFGTVPGENWLDASEPWVAEWADRIGMAIPASWLVNMPRHPVQLYELVLEGIILFFILLGFRNIGKPKPRGSVVSLFLLAYGVMRFWIEFYRHPVSHSATILGSEWFTISMLYCIPMIVLGALGMWFSFKRAIPNEIYGNPDRASAVKTVKKVKSVKSGKSANSGTAAGRTSSRKKNNGR